MTAQNQGSTKTRASGTERGQGPLGGYLPPSIAAFGPGVRPDDRSLAVQAGTYRLILALARLWDSRFQSRPAGSLTAPRSVAARLQGP
ncbi:MAG TPA: hypothetical protein PKA33_04705 [Amaricoccus sp.]|uniref:hypothetical protein n=1 Tax=Amaricoccus sp. TaxID=1872485 RepID=UPI002C743660|nr:hypothetical protein [Amaricoccus sp.]HMQ91651.1 hypothetical protein [Amaricoccus sp.]HMT98656.1 hypothetical protein [Amaricoccus sp.]